jgi:hypothetical protein
MVIATTFIVAAGCGTADSGGPQLQATVDTVGDTVTVRTLAGSVWGDTADLVSEISIGTMEGADEYIFGSPTQLAVAPDGTIYVLDRQVPVVRAYGPDGTYLRDLGRDGAGPGEYNNPDGLGVLPDGRVIVKDPGNARIQVFTPGGEPAGGWSYIGGWNTSFRFHVDTAGQSYATVLLEAGLPPWEWTYGLERRSADGELLDTVPAPTWTYEVPRVTGQREGSSSSSPVPFSARTMFTFSPLGYVVGALSTDYRIDLHRGPADVLRIERTWDPVSILADERGEQERRITENFRGNFPGWRWNGPSIPDTKPPFTDIFAGNDGRIWVQVAQTGVPVMTETEAQEEEDRTGRPVMRFRTPATFDVFEPDGTYLGVVRTPDDFSAFPTPVARGDYIWAVTRDDFDVATVHRFRIVVRGAPSD